MVVFLFALGAMMYLGMLDWGGSIGASLDRTMAYIFGWDRLVLPAMIMAWAMYIHAPEKFTLRFSNALGCILFFFTFNPIIHVWSFSGAVRANDAALQVAGGKLGEMLAILFSHSLGVPGLVAMATALLIVALLLMFNATLDQVLFALRWLIKMVMWAIQTIADVFRKRREERLRKQEEQKFKDALDRSTIAEQARTANTDAPTSANAPAAQKSPNVNQEHDDDDEETIPEKPRKHYPRIEIPFELLEHRDQRPTSGDISHNREVIRRTLDTFGIPVEMGEVSVGPTVTQFTLKPSDGVKLARIVGLHNDLALALAAHPIRIEAPIPGKSLVGIEVPNQMVATVGIREILEGREFHERKSGLTFIVGRDVAGKPWLADLGRMPHLLVAGATGSGKSVCLNVAIMSFLYGNGPDDLKMIMVDPKRVELQVYNGIPHLITPVITKVQETVNALKWSLREMDRRYDLLSKFGARDLASYNARVQDRLPSIVIIIDELADLMSMAAAEIEGPVVRLAQMSRAVGIHLVLATQRPSVDVITGLIKANIPARMAFAVASQTDSRTILDQQGAEKLLGRGDMLLFTAEMPSPKRLQGAFISDAEIGRVVGFIKSKYDPADYDPSVVERQNGGTVFSSGGGMDNDEDDSDPLLEAAKEEIIRAGKASASLLQRRLKVGYARAARILDLLEQEGFIGPGEGAKPREILKADFTTQMEPSATPASQEAGEENAELENE